MSNIIPNFLKETSPSRLLRTVSTDFFALRLFCFNIRHHGCFFNINQHVFIWNIRQELLYFKLNADGRKFHH